MSHYTKSIERNLLTIWCAGIIFVFSVPLIAIFLKSNVDKHYIVSQTNYIKNHTAPKQGGVIDDAPEAWNNKRYVKEIN